MGKGDGAVQRFVPKRKAGRPGKAARRAAAAGLAMGRFVEAIGQGATIAEAARIAGRAPSGFYQKAKACPAFAAAWREAVERSNGPVLIARGSHGRLQKRKSRRVRFDRRRKETFLGQLAACGDAEAAARAAGVCSSTAFKHLVSDPAFAEGWEAAMEASALILEAELVAQQRAAMEKYRVEPAAADPEGRDFERSLKLIEKIRRSRGGGGRTGLRAPKRADPRQVWSFERAMALIEQKLKRFGVRIPDVSEIEGEAREIPAAEIPPAGEAGDEAA